MSPSHVSPKSLLESSKKLSKLKVSTSSHHENPSLNLISPKDLVRIAMSKHKSKDNVKKITVQNMSSLPRNFRKSLSLRFVPGLTGLEKREGSKLVSISHIDDNSALSRTTLQSKDKAAKLRRMKMIYNDLTTAEMARLTRSSMQTPGQDVSGRFWQGSLSPNRSNSGVLWPGSPTGTGTTSATQKSKQHGNALETKSHRKMSLEQMGVVPKEYKPGNKQAKRQDKKPLQARKMPSMENLKAASHSFSRLMSQNTIPTEVAEKAKTPLMDFKGVDEEMDETMEALEESEDGKDKEIKPREEFIADLKNWVNDIVKPQDEPTPAKIPKKNGQAAEKVKEAQEGLLEKLRGALENDEFVRREDYERLLRERDAIEDELDNVKEENVRLREIIWRIQEEMEVRRLNEIEEKKAQKSVTTLPMNISISDHDEDIREAFVQQQKELEGLRKRENIVKDVLRLIWRAGIEIGDFHYDEEMREDQEGEDEEYHEQGGNGMMQVNQQMGEEFMKEPSYDPYEKPKKVYMEYYKLQEKFGKDLQPIGENVYKEEGGADDESYTNGIPEQREEIEESEMHIQALSEMCESEVESSFQVNNAKKTTSNPKSTADSSRLFSAKPKTPQAALGSKPKGKLRLDLTGLGGNMSVPKSNTYSGHSSAEKINKFIMTDGGQSLGFHEEFMSKLEEFSLSWRQAAINNQKF